MHNVTSRNVSRRCRPTTKREHQTGTTQFHHYQWSGGTNEMQPSCLDWSPRRVPQSVSERDKPQPLESKLDRSFFLLKVTADAASVWAVSGQHTHPWCTAATVQCRCQSIHASPPRVPPHLLAASSPPRRLISVVISCRRGMLGTFARSVCVMISLPIRASFHTLDNFF